MGYAQQGSKIDLKNCVVFLKTIDAGDNPITLAIKMGTGNARFSMPAQYTYELDRGKLDDVRRGDEQPVDVSIEGKFTNMLSQGAELPSILEIITGKKLGNVSDHGSPLFKGTAESWLSSLGCPPYACEIEIHNNPKLECADSTALGEAWLFRYFRSEARDADLSSGMINASGKCNILYPIAQRLEFAYSTFADAEPLEDWVADPRSL